MTEEKNKELDSIVEQIGRDMPFKEKTEIGEVFDNLDKDEPAPNSLSHIDFNANLTQHEVSCCIIFDELKNLGIIPKKGDLTRQKKRLSRSEGALGSKQKVEIASASRSADLSGRSGGMLSKLVTPRD